MTKMQNWEIKPVDKDKGIVTVIYNGEEYSYTIKNGQLVCLSKKQLDEKVFSDKKKQLWAILNKYLPKNRRKGNGDNEKERLENLAGFRCYVLDDGNLLISFNHEGKMQPSVYWDIDSAIRAQGHIQDKYLGGDEEIPELIKIYSSQEAIATVRKALFDWKNSSPDELAQAEDILLKAAENFKLCRNELKLSAAWKLESSREFTDKTGKKNPGATLARTLAANTRLEKRTCDIKGIDQHVAGRKAALILEKRQMELNILDATFKLKMIVNSSDKYFENRKVAEDELGRVMHLLQSVWLNPYVHSAREAMKDILHAKLKISKKEIGLAKKFISRAISTLQSIQ